MKTFFTFVLTAALAFAAADTSAMGYPTNALANRKASGRVTEDPKLKQKKAAESPKKQLSSKWLVALAEPKVNELITASHESNNIEYSAVEKMSSVIVRVLDAEGAVIREKEMPQAQLLSGSDKAGLLRNSRFVALLEGIAYYISLGKEAL
jgi:uncharacterized FlaG/YvyC family protein